MPMKPKTYLVITGSFYCDQNITSETITKATRLSLETTVINRKRLT